MSGYKVGPEVLPAWGNLSHEKVSPQRAIRMFCAECMGGHIHPWIDNDGNEVAPYKPYDDVRACESKTCWLHPYRTGRNPYSARKGNPSALRAHRDSRK